MPVVKSRMRCEQSHSFRWSISSLTPYRRSQTLLWTISQILASVQWLFWFWRIRRPDFEPGQKGSPKHNQPIPTGSSKKSDSYELSVIELPSIPLIRNPGWDEQTILSSYLIDPFFTWHENPTSPESASWISALLQSNGDSGVLSFASTRALVTSYFTKIHGHSDLMGKGAGFTHVH